MCIASPCSKIGITLVLNYNSVLTFCISVLIYLFDLSLPFLHRDIIHYDPTRHDHATYERKRDNKPKER